MRCDYKIIPLNQPHPAYPDETSVWMPLLPVRLSYRHGKQTPRIEALINSGASDCLFRADICPLLGITLEKGIKSSTSGIVPGERIDVYFHDVNLWVVADRIRIRAGFSDRLSVGALLGRHGFFENFIITFDPSNSPPGFDIVRIARA